MKSPLCRLWFVFALIATSVVRADHRDAVNDLADPRVNINDAYAFVNPNNTGNVVLAMTVNGMTAPGVAQVFAPGCLYQFKIDNTGDFIEDRVIQITFDKPVGPAFAATQNFAVVGPIKPPKVGGTNSLAKTTTPILGPVTSSGSAFTTGVGGIKVFCGPREDPFFFDEIAIRNVIRANAPIPSQTRVPGVDYYSGLNCSVIALEVPSALLVGTLVNQASNQKQLNIWATASVPTSTARSLRSPARGEPLEIRESTSKSFVQWDRAALGAISFFLVAEEDKNAFCAGQPKDDVKFFAEPAKALIQRLGANPTDQLLGAYFPDVLRLDVAGNAALGRRPADDVIDRALNVLTAGVLTGDAVNANDVPFLTDFPFFAPAHSATESVPRRN